MQCSSEVYNRVVQCICVFSNSVFTSVLVIQAPIDTAALWFSKVKKKPQKTFANIQIISDQNSRKFFKRLKHQWLLVFGNKYFEKRRRNKSAIKRIRVQLGSSSRTNNFFFLIKDTFHITVWTVYWLLGLLHFKILLTKLYKINGSS